MDERGVWNAARVFYILLLIGGIILYLIWGILYSAWFDVGLYSIVILMVGFGIVGGILYGYKID